MTNIGIEFISHYKYAEMDTNNKKMRNFYLYLCRLILSSEVLISIYYFQRQFNEI